MKERLKCSVASVGLSSPLILASGHITENADFFTKTAGCAGMVTRSLKEFPPPERKNTPAPRYVVFDNGHSMLNCEWGNSVPWTYWKNQGVSIVKNLSGAIIISLSGREIESCCNLIQEFDKLGVDAFEINVSCSHSGAIHGNLNIDFSHTEELLSKIRPLTKTPIWLKLSYSSYLTDMARLAESLGADAIVCTNSIGPGMFIDTKTATPKLGIMGGAGGVTGRAIFPIALNCVYKLAQTVSIPIVGSGGIASADDVVQMLMAGASAVQLYTEPALNGPQVFAKIAKGLEDYLDENDETIGDLVGLAQGKREQHNFVQNHSTIRKDNCIGCGRCVTICDFDAITTSKGNSRPVIDSEKCVGCSACASVCPVSAIDFS